MRALVIASILVMLTACAKKTARELDHDLIRVTMDARLRTDTVGGGAHTDLATFVLVEAENTSKEGAYVTLAGELTDATGARLSELRPQSLWVPAGEIRTYALIDRERKPRPAAKGAKIYVRGARINQPPPAHVDGVREVPDGDKIVVQGTLVNEGARGGDIMVLATFYGADGRPMTRPFSVLWVEARGRLPVQFVGPPGSTRATMFIGDTAF